MIACCCTKCRWKGNRPVGKVTRKPCPGCDGEVTTVAERDAAVRAALQHAQREVEKAIIWSEVAATAQALAAPPVSGFDRPAHKDPEPLHIPNELRIFVMDEGRFIIHRIPAHLRKGAKRRRR
jgi:hypothetical protein